MRVFVFVYVFDATGGPEASLAAVSRAASRRPLRPLRQDAHQPDVLYEALVSGRGRPSRVCLPCGTLSLPALYLYRLRKAYGKGERLLAYVHEVVVWAYVRACLLRCGAYQFACKARSVGSTSQLARRKARRRPVETLSVCSVGRYGTEGCSLPVHVLLIATGHIQTPHSACV